MEKPKMILVDVPEWNLNKKAKRLAIEGNDFDPAGTDSLYIMLGVPEDKDGNPKEGYLLLSLMIYQGGVPYYMADFSLTLDRKYINPGYINTSPIFPMDERDEEFSLSTITQMLFAIDPEDFLKLELAPGIPKDDPRRVDNAVRKIMEDEQMMRVHKTDPKDIN